MSICTLCPTVQPNLLKRPRERLHTSRYIRIIRGPPHEYTDAPHSLGLLRPHVHRPCCNATQQSNELTPSHAPLNSGCPLTLPSTSLAWRSLAIPERLRCRLVPVH